MEEGKVILTTKEYMELVERANINQLLMNEIMNHRAEVQHIYDRINDLENRLFSVERK